jgi:DNA-binding CsgD family transcriptional regulator
VSTFARVQAAIVPLFATLSLSPDPVFVTDRHNKIVFWNQSAERCLGYAEDEVVGSPCGPALQGCDVFGNRYCTDNCPVTQIAARGESVRRFNLSLRAKDGHTVPAEVSILHLVAKPPDGFYLAHVLRPLDRPENPGLRPAPGADAPAPRPPLDLAHESSDARARRLTAREVEVLGMLAAGHTTPDIALRLHISNLTARNHVQNILDKLEVHSKAEAVAFAFQKHLF